jgi:hypothetical protein
MPVALEFPTVRNARAGGVEDWTVRGVLAGRAQRPMVTLDVAPDRTELSSLGDTWGCGLTHGIIPNIRESSLFGVASQAQQSAVV